jgi:hypothetical protein
MPIPLGVLAVAGAGAGPVAAGNGYEWLETQILGNDTTASVTFSSLNTNYGSTYKHLQLRITARLTGAVNFEEIYFRFNGSNSNNYRWHWLKSNGTSIVSSTATDNAGRISITTPGANASADIFGAIVCDVLDAFSTNKYKTIRSLSGSMGAANGVELLSSNWYNETSAITSILVGSNSGFFKQGTRVSLYGMRST